MGTRLLIDEEPLQVLPSLAVAIGLNEAIILQQLHYWLKRSEHTMDGKRWIYNTYEQWRGQFPFWSHDTIKRAVHELERVGLVESTMRFNRNPIDRTKWYTIAYERLAEVCGSTMQDAPTSEQVAPTTMQNAPMDGAKWVDDGADCTHSQRLQTETTTEISEPLPIVLPLASTKVQAANKKDGWRDVLEHLIVVSGRPFRTPGLIVSALTQGYLEADLVLVIDWWAAVKTVEDPGQSKYFDNDTPFRPTKIDKYHAAAVVWDREGRHAALRPGVIHPRSAQAIQALVKEVHDDGGPRLPQIFDRHQPARRSLGGPGD